MTLGPRVSAIVVHYQTERYLGQCLDALARASASLLETVVVDNASIQDVARWRGAYPQVVWLVQPHNRGFAAAVNAGIRMATGEYVLILNADAWPVDGALEQLIGRLDERSNVAVVSPQLFDVAGVPQSSGGRAPTLTSMLLQKIVPRVKKRSVARGTAAADAVQVDWASAAAILCRRMALDEVGGMDEGFFLYYEDCDLGMRLRRRGWRIELLSGAHAIHVGGASFATQRALQLRSYDAGQDRYFLKHRPPLERLMLRIARRVYRLMREVRGPMGSRP